MTSNHRYIFVGRKNKEDALHPGGQLTASKGLQRYAYLKEYELDIIDTTQSSFPIPPFFVRLNKSIKRFCLLIYFLSTRKVKGAIIFSSSGWSFYEKSFMAFLCRCYGVQSFLFLRTFIHENPLTNFVFKMPTLVGVQGESLKKIYAERKGLENRLVVIRNWLDYSKTVASVPKKIVEGEPLKFCFVGWLVEEKGVLELFKAIAQLARSYSFSFYFVGGGKLYEFLKSEVKKNELDNHIYLTGWVDSEGVFEILKSSHIFVLPSKIEGFSNALLEALSCGLPIIATDVGALSDSVIDEKNGFLLSDCNASTIEKAMLQYLVSPDLIYAHSLNSLKICKEHHDFLKNCGLLFEVFS